MTTTTLHPQAAAYLDRLRHASRRLPRSVRHELVQEVEAHLVEVSAEATSEAEVLDALDRLGEPEDIVAAEQPLSETPPEYRSPPPRFFSLWAYRRQHR